MQFVPFTTTVFAGGASISGSQEYHNHRCNLRTRQEQPVTGLREPPGHYGKRAPQSSRLASRSSWTHRQRGAKDHNQRLCEIHESAVRNYLLQTIGVATDRITVHGYGEMHPLVKNSISTGHAANRRVEDRILNPEALKLEVSCSTAAFLA